MKPLGKGYIGGWSSTAPAKQAQASKSPFATDEEEKKDQQTAAVKHAPGGSSSIQLGGDDDGSRFQTSAQAAAQGSQGEVKPAAGATKKKDENDVPQARQPPGGKSNITF